jgi:hypothetical protein
MDRHTVAGMITFLSTILTLLSSRLRNRADLELEILALRHQLSVLRRQHRVRVRLAPTDRILWVCLYRIWPLCLSVMVLVKPAAVVNGIELASGPTGDGAPGPAILVDQR